MTSTLDPLAESASRSERTGLGSPFGGGLLAGPASRSPAFPDSTYVPSRAPRRDVTFAAILASVAATLVAIGDPGRDGRHAETRVPSGSGTSPRGVEGTSEDGALDVEAYLALASRALGDGHLELGRRVIRAGLVRHPGAPALQAAEDVLAPPRAFDAPPAKPPAPASLAWVDSIAPHYRGEWIVVEGTQVRGHAKRLADLTELIARLGDSALTMRIPEAR